MAKNKPVSDANESAVAEMLEPTGKQLVAYLKDSGTPFARLRPLEEWAKANPEATAEDLYRHMEASGSSQGTLRKAGKWVFGAEFEPENVVKDAPADEMLRLREENENFRGRIAELQSDSLGRINQLKYKDDQIAELTRKITFLSMGKSREELAQIGL